MKKKGQAAMEFLMTYGWAILVVLAAIAALAYFGVLNPSRFLPETCQLPAGLVCVGGKASVDGVNDRVELGFRNELGFSVNVTGVTDSDTADECDTSSVEACVGTACTPAAVPTVFQNGQQGIVRLGCSNDVSSGNRFSQDVSIQYKNVQTGVTHSAALSVTGTAS